MIGPYFVTFNALMAVVMCDLNYKLSNLRLAIIGLVYVGLPLAVEFGKQRSVIGFDIDQARIKDLSKGLDRTLEVSAQELLEASYLTYTCVRSELTECNCFIVTVPTPLDSMNQPEVTALIEATKMIGSILKPCDLVVYESTVYPGATREICVPILERVSGLTFNEEFFIGYSPERTNPGDKEHRISNIKKITSGSTDEAAELIDLLYNQIVKVGTHKAPSIEVAEAAKVIENTQRDINIALVNELAIIFNIMGIDSEAVLKAAGTKWNFLPFRPGLVGGHCIGVDPYYLTYKAQSLGYEPEIILAGRKLNESMSEYIADRLVNCMAQKDIMLSGAKILIMGLTFKENCPDIRNTKIMDIIKNLINLGCSVDVFDPWVTPEDANSTFGIKVIEEPLNGAYDAIVLAVAHNEFRLMGAEAVRAFGKLTHVLYDLKHVFGELESDLRL